LQTGIAGAGPKTAAAGRYHAGVRVRVL